MCWHNCEFYIAQLAIKARTAVSSLIYRKALQLSDTSVMKLSSGRIVSLISKDLYTFDSTINCIVEVPIGLIHVAVMTFIMYRAIGVSALAGVGYVFLAMPVQSKAIFFFLVWFEI